MGYEREIRDGTAAKGEIRYSIAALNVRRRVVQRCCKGRGGVSHTYPTTVLFRHPQIARISPRENPQILSHNCCNCENAIARILKFTAARAETIGKSRNFRLWLKLGDQGGWAGWAGLTPAPLCGHDTEFAYLAVSERAAYLLRTG